MDENIAKLSDHGKQIFLETLMRELEGRSSNELQFYKKEMGETKELIDYFNGTKTPLPQYEFRYQKLFHNIPKQ